MRALVDGDLVAFRAAASAEKEDVQIALFRTDRTVQDILDESGATEHIIFLTGDKNFRKEVCPDYKANRKDRVLPQHLAACKQFLVTHWKANTCNGYEADDGLGMAQRDHGTVLCSLDKDLLMVTGHHYNWVKKLHTVITPDEGLKRFYTQLLVGDTSDNVFGIKGIGPVKAARILDQLLPEEYYTAVRTIYNDDERLHRNGKLLWIWRKEGDIWQPPAEDSWEYEAEEEGNRIP
jgi:5'-3' exonuclease